MQRLRTKLAYLAGIIDGEGCISIAKCKQKEYRDKFFYSLRIQVVNTNAEVIDWIGRIFGASITIKKHKNYTNIGYYACWRGSKAVDMLVSVFPYLIIKKKQARVILKYWPKSKGINPKLRDKIHYKIKELNQNGKGKRIS